MKIALNTTTDSDSDYHTTTATTTTSSSLMKKVLLKTQHPDLLLRDELLYAGQELSSRCLFSASTWANELAFSIGCGSVDDKEEEVSPCFDSESAAKLSEQDVPRVLLARSYFNMREFYHAAHVLKGVTGQVAVFLRCYSLFLAGERRKEQEKLEVPEGERTQVCNRELKLLHHELRSFGETVQLDGFNLYMLGIVLRELEMVREARHVLIESVNIYPWNFSAWKDLASVCEDMNDVQIILKNNIKKHWMRDFFLGHVTFQHQKNVECLKIYESLESHFPNSVYIKAKKAVISHNQQDFDGAAKQFEEIIAYDPFSLQHMDTYSNILYVKEDSVTLSILAQRAVEIDKYRPETCCIIGNYYSLKSDHEKAVLYFQRATKLDRNNLSAFTLMGHEYLQLKNINASIEAYRKALDVDQMDYRAWYGLGQTYQMLRQPLYSLYYFGKASRLRPYDPRMWCALGGCYEALQRPHAAIACYKRARDNNDRDGGSLSRLAKLFLSIKNIESAAFYYKMDLAHRDKIQMEGQETVEALLFLANYSKSKGHYKDTERYCSRLLDFAGREKEEAKAILRELHNLPQQQIDQ